MEINIGSRVISAQERPYFIADIAANHDGDLNRAFKLIELAKESGADAAKFQNFKAPTIVSRKGFEAMGSQLSHQKNWNKPVYDVYQDASIPDEWTPLLKEHCKKVGIEYMTSPYDFHSIDLAAQYSNCLKIGSGDITWLDSLSYAAKKGKPVLLAIGASDWTDVQRAVDEVLKWNDKLVVMQCNTNYTANRENYQYINLNVLKTLKNAYPSVLLGLSDHTFGYATVLGAIALGACVIEKHFTDDNTRTGPDHRFSMTPQSWREMVNESENLFQALGDGSKRIEQNEQETVIVQRRALYYTKNLPCGHVLEEADLIPLRPIPQGAIPPYDLQKLLGKKLTHDVQQDTCAGWEHVQ